MPSPLRVAQTHLKMLEQCPRLFQHRVLDQLSPPVPPAEQERLQQGQQFHLILQQWLLDLPVQPIVAAEPHLEARFQAFQAAADTIVAPGTRLPEHDRSLLWGDYLLMGRYDLLVLGADYAHILDWKTYAQPRQPADLIRHWQTRLYCFLLAETSAYPPEAIALIYWFFQPDATDSPARSQPQSQVIPYSQPQHEATRQDLSRLLTQLTAWLAAYQDGEAFPQIPVGSQRCATCAFGRHCGREAVASAADPSPNRMFDNGLERRDHREGDRRSIPAFEDIAELPL